MIPIKRLNLLLPKTLASKHLCLRMVKFVIGEMVDFLLSDEFLEKRVQLAEILIDACDQLLKLCTLLTNYAPFYAISWKINSIFADALAEQMSLYKLRQGTSIFRYVGLSVCPSVEMGVLSFIFLCLCLIYIYKM